VRISAGTNVTADSLLIVFGRGHNSFNAIARIELFGTGGLIRHSIKPGMAAFTVPVHTVLGVGLPIRFYALVDDPLGISIGLSRFNIRIVSVHRISASPASLSFCALGLGPEPGICL
jgi:hypothetical protein